MKWFRWICLCGVITNLLAWGMPDSMRYYHVRHWMDDYKIELVEQKHEYGFARHGLVCGRFSVQYSAGNPKLIDQLRSDWYDNIRWSKKPWPANSSRFQYDEWGPSHVVRPDGIEVVEVGQVWTLPYSLGAIVCAVPVVWWLISIALKRLYPRPCTSGA